MSSIWLFLGLLMVSGPPQKPAPTFKGFIRLPVDLYLADGTHLDEGQYVIEVKSADGQYSLLFQNDQTKGTIKGEAAPAGESDQMGFPLMGTQYLRSSADPVGTEAQRHFSKSGLPQYEEENRDWKASLRVYTTNDQKETHWLFEQRQQGDMWTHILFRLSLVPPLK